MPLSAILWQSVLLVEETGEPGESAGTWPFIQSLICNANNKCYQTVTSDEAAGFTSAGNPQSL
jgi:hypothetical protein